MDPVTIVSLAAACTSLAVAAGKSVIALKKLAGAYKDSSLAIRSLANECNTIALAVQQLRNWIESPADVPDLEEDIWLQLKESIEFVELVLASLAGDLKSVLDVRTNGSFRRKGRAVWILQFVNDHQSRLRGQAIALTLLLNTTKLYGTLTTIQIGCRLTDYSSPSRSRRDQSIEEGGEVFDGAADSARTIIDSSASMSTWRTQGSRTRPSMDEVAYKPFAFENQLFTSGVYKRNFRPKRASITKVRVIFVPSSVNAAKFKDRPLPSIVVTDMGGDWKPNETQLKRASNPHLLSAGSAVDDDGSSSIWYTTDDDSQVELKFRSRASMAVDRFDTPHEKAERPDAMGSEKWYIGGRTAAGEEKFYRLGRVTRRLGAPLIKSTL